MNYFKKRSLALIYKAKLTVLCAVRQERTNLIVI